jgi:DNA-binding transcriptional regulator GbsR (MarR family)
VNARGHIVKTPKDARAEKLKPWETLVIEAVGNTIDFWHFKRNHGRVWALLYLRGKPLSQAELQRDLELSKGAASMVTNELEVWGVVQRVRVAGDATWRYAAETDLTKMIRRVLSERELAFVERVLSDLEDAYAAAKADKTTPPEVLARLNRMRTLASLVDKALRAFLLTAKLDVGSAMNVLSESPKKRT